MNIYNNVFKTVQGDTIELSNFQNKVLLIVNTASNCGWTWQYDELEKLHKAYQSKGLVILAFPSNNFGEQEPGSNEQIAEFCSNKYNITFPILEKSVVIGDNQNPLYKELIDITGDQPGWNFNKYIIGKNASIIKFFDQEVNPTDKTITELVNLLLQQD